VIVSLEQSGLDLLTDTEAKDSIELQPTSIAIIQLE
jgi:hypothetical protein